MTFSKYDLVKAQYIVSERYKFHLCLCADRECTDHVWHALLYSREAKTNKELYIFVIPKGLNFTEEQYEIYKRFFIRYVKDEKVKEKLEKINKDFV